MLRVYMSVWVELIMRLYFLFHVSPSFFFGTRLGDNFHYYTQFDFSSLF